MAALKKTILRSPLLRVMVRASALALLLIGPAAEAASAPLSPQQNALLLNAATAFAQGDYQPAAEAFPQLQSTYMGSWVGYWALQPRLKTLSQAQYQQYSGQFPEGVAHHLLRRQWLLELARRQDWTDFTTVYQSGPVPDLITLRCDAARDPALRGSSVVQPYFLWSAAPANNHACNAMAQTALAHGQIASTQLWQRLRQMFEASAFQSALHFASYLEPSAALQLDRIVRQPAVWLSQQTSSYGNAPWPQSAQNLRVLALLRLAAAHPSAAVQMVQGSSTLSAADQALVLYNAAYQGTLKLRPEAGPWYALAYRADPQFSPRPQILAWMVRTALRNSQWNMVVEATALMDAAQRQQKQWQFWNTVARLELGHTASARAQFKALASPWSYTGQLAMAALGQPLTLDASATHLEDVVATSTISETTSERAALKLYQLGLYYDALSEWDHDLHQLSDPAQIKAVARLAFQQQAWLLGIHASSLVQDNGDWQQGYILPYAQEIAQAAAATGLHRAFLAGLIRQESGFAFGIRSDVGAQGLMQVMPTTAQWLQNHIPAAANADLHSVRGNLVLGSNYLSLQQQNFGGSELLAAAAYNAGPGAPKHWLARWNGPTEGPWAGPIFTANIPYQQTRRYVESVLTNTVVYAALLDRQPQNIWPHWQLGSSQQP